MRKQLVKQCHKLGNITGGQSLDGPTLYIRTMAPGEVLASVTAYIMGNHDGWDVLLGKQWMRR